MRNAESDGAYPIARQLISYAGSVTCIVSQSNSNYVSRQELGYFEAL